MNLHEKVIHLLTDTVLYKIAKEKGNADFKGDFMFIIKNCCDPSKSDSGEYKYKYCFNGVYNWEYNDGCLIVFVGRPKADNKITFEGTYWELKNFAMKFNRIGISGLFRNNKDQEREETEKAFAENQKFLKELRGENLNDNGSGKIVYTSDDDVSEDIANEIYVMRCNLIDEIQKSDQ